MSSDARGSGTSDSVPTDLYGHADLHRLHDQCIQPPQEATPYAQPFDCSIAPSGMPFLGTVEFHPSPSRSEQSWMPVPPLDSGYGTASTTELSGMTNEFRPYHLEHDHLSPARALQSYLPSSHENVWTHLPMNDQVQFSGMSQNGSCGSSPAHEQSFISHDPGSITSSVSSDSDSSRPSATPPVYRSAAEMIPAPDGHESTMYHFSEKWKGKDHVPSRQELEAMAKVVHLPLVDFAMWFGAKVQFAPNVAVRSISDDYSNANQALPSDIAGLIHGYILQHNQQKCKRYSGPPEFYRCTWGCGYSAKKRDAWEQHEATRQPQQFWVCADCRLGEAGDPKAPHINHRGDTFLEHAKLHAKLHPDVSELKYRTDLRDRSEVQTVAPFHRNCKYRYSNGTTCNQHFVSWKERNDHHIRHFAEEASNHLAETLKRNPYSNDANCQEERSDKRRKLPARTTTLSSTSSLGSNVGGSGRVLAADRLEKTQMRHANIFIDVLTRQSVQVNLESRFLALKYSRVWVQTSRQCQYTTCHNTEASKSSLDSAIKLTQEMGVRYLWVGICSTEVAELEGAEAVLRKALFVIVIGPGETTNRMTQFACKYSQLSMVQDWVQHDITFSRVQFLGQGSYSLVDKVEVRYSSNASSQLDTTTFARKTVVRSSAKRSSAISECLQEIEIMQRFNHPHIARFVAAYYEGDTLNILMSPVADYDLRQYLSYPERFPEERQFIPQWFVCLAKAVAHIHESRCRHKDIKPANILISNHQVLLTDFGTSTHFSNDQSTTAGNAFMTPKYCAPEVAALGERGRSADIWSLGCVFLEMLTVLQHFSLTEFHTRIQMDSVSADRHHTYHSQRSGLLSWLTMISAIKRESGVEAFSACIRKMLHSEARARPTAAQVVQMLQESHRSRILASARKQTSVPCCSSCLGTFDNTTLENSMIEDHDNGSMVEALLHAVTL